MRQSDDFRAAYVSTKFVAGTKIPASKKIAAGTKIPSSTKLAAGTKIPASTEFAAGRKNVCWYKNSC